MIFPHPELANSLGLLAIGGDLTIERLLLAYRFGIFPWYSEGQPIQWWSPNPRCVLFPHDLKVSKSMRSLFKKEAFDVTVDHAFQSVIKSCRTSTRNGQAGTWITPDMEEAYLQLHYAGFAHSVEVWEENKLVGGLYGISIGKVFFGESMFTKVSNASKYGFILLVNALKAKSFEMIDCQQDTPHLRSLGAKVISRRDFLSQLRTNNRRSTDAGSWSGTILPRLHS